MRSDMSRLLDSAISPSAELALWTPSIDHVFRFPSLLRSAEPGRPARQGRRDARSPVRQSARNDSELVTVPPQADSWSRNRTEPLAAPPQQVLEPSRAGCPRPSRSSQNAERG